ncbi:hypothetical protein Fmac_019237 [Flemingia macrophylla]|uniref:Peptidase C1A papain C-terminal domain-containing protein n=1 Tax=Flemingia macrophylla TaxID=520843 RepID=A0ABD1M793_9FABA
MPTLLEGVKCWRLLPHHLAMLKARSKVTFIAKGHRGIKTFLLAFDHGIEGWINDVPHHCDNINGNEGCQDGAMETAFAFIKKMEALPQIKTIHFKDQMAYVARPNLETMLTDAVAHQPVSVGIYAGGYASQLYPKGIFCGSWGKNFNHGMTIVWYRGKNSNHGMTIVGKNINHGKYWIVKNSWASDRVNLAISDRSLILRIKMVLVAFSWKLATLSSINKITRQIDLLCL